MANPETQSLELLLEFLKGNRGFDFTGYKRASLERRLHKRMELIGVDTFEAYLDVLQAQPDEFTELFNTLLINVTRFFRDDSPWDFLAKELVPLLANPKPGSQAIRVWSAGCATGEEPYTLAMILCEALGVETFRERVKIYATDVDESALAIARSAIYTESQIENVPPDLLSSYFERTHGRFTFRKDIRRCVIFGRNDLVQDAPISRIDLLVCRNTLMYFNAPTQASIIARFHFALADSGILFLGRAETLITHSSAFTPIDLKRRLFCKVPRPSIQERILLSSQAGVGESGDVTDQLRLRDEVFETGATAQIVLDRVGRLVLMNERARAAFSLVPADVGRLIQDLEFSYRPAELRPMLDQCYTDRRPVIAREVLWRQRTNGDERFLDLVVSPLFDSSGTPAGASIAATDVTAQRALRSDLEESRQRLATAYEQLQSTNEELETTNEEMQSTVEELETTNEELQSTNEELETMNEELQSMNEETQTSNDELRRRSDDLNDANAFLEGILVSLRAGVAVIDLDHQVLVWNALAFELWGLRSNEAVGSNFFAMDIGLQVADLANPIDEAVRTSKPVQASMPAVNRRGRAFTCQVTATPLLTPGGDPRGVILLMEDSAE